MKLYHASKHQFDTVKRQQASHPAAEEFAVPECELQNKIYFTPNIGFTIAMAAGPDGMTSLEDGKISFEHYEQFDHERPVYVYEIDSHTIDPTLIETVDDEQVAVDLDEVTPEKVHVYRAADVFTFYELAVWKPAT